MTRNPTPTPEPSALSNAGLPWPTKPGKHEAPSDPATALIDWEAVAKAWKQIARRLDDAHNDGQPLWAYLSYSETRAMCAEDDCEEG